MPFETIPSIAFDDSHAFYSARVMPDNPNTISYPTSPIRFIIIIVRFSC